MTIDTGRTVPTSTTSTSTGASDTRSTVGVFRERGGHWVGDGFYVNQIIPGTQGIAALADPFILLDYNAPWEVQPSETPGGVGSHPHRGFETVTYALEGAVAHHDSHGNSGVIYPGDVQWMTAGAGVFHKEYHEQEFARRGGTFHMLQLWVNLPAEKKMTEPGYQHLSADGMGKVDLPTGGNATIIAGDLLGVSGPATTHSPVYFFDVTVTPNERARLPIAAGQTAFALVVEGSLVVDDAPVERAGIVAFDTDGAAIELTAGSDGARAIVLGGEPLREPVVSYGPFVMNTDQEIRQAIRDFASGKFGQLD